MQKICSDAWNIIVTNFEDSEIPSDEDAVTKIVTNVTFSEGLLRNILDLNEDQQVELVRELATNPNFSKGKFKTLADNYQASPMLYPCQVTQSKLRIASPFLALNAASLRFIEVIDEFKLLYTQQWLLTNKMIF